MSTDSVYFGKSIRAFKKHMSFVWIYSQLQIHTMLYVAIPKHRVLLTRTNQKIHHNFSVFEHMKLAQNYAEVSLPSPHPI